MAHLQSSISSPTTIPLNVADVVPAPEFNLKVWNAPLVSFCAHTQILSPLVQTKPPLESTALFDSLSLTSTESITSRACSCSSGATSSEQLQTSRLARIMKKDFKKRGIEKLKVVYSKEQPINTNDCAINQKDSKYKVKGSISFVPSVAGLIIAGEVIKDIAGRI